MNNFSIPSTHAERKITYSLINTLLLYIPLLALRDGQNHRQRNEYTCCTWAGGTFFLVVLLCQFLVVVRNSFRCYLPTISVVPLCFFFLWQEIDFGFTDRSVFLLWRENPKQSDQKYCGASSLQVSDNHPSCQNTNTTNHTLI